MLARRTSEVAFQLLQALKAPEVSSQFRGLGSLCQALKAVWGKEKIDKLMQQLGSFRSEMELRILVDLRRDAAIQNIRTDARLDSMSADVKAISIAILDGYGQIFDRLDALIQTVRTGQHETNMLIIESRDKILNAVVTLTNSASPRNLARAEAAPLTNSNEIANEVENIILDELSFGRMDVREESILPAHEATFKWILDDSPDRGKPWPNLIQWLRNDGECYWINGKAASGKSTLMKFLTRQPQIRSALQAWAGSKELLIIPFFFWHLGSDLQRSQAGLLRSMLHSILSKCRGLIAKVMPGYYNEVARKARCADERKQLLSVEPLTLIELKIAFLKLFGVLPENLRLCLFVDGIDEFSGDYTDLAELLKTVVSPKVKIVLSSRPIRPCVAAFQNYPTLRLQDLTKDDMVSYVRAQFNANHDMESLRKRQPGDVDRLLNEITSRSSGVFLWVELVVKSLLRGLTAGDHMADLRRRLYQYPEELEPLYRHMLDGVDEMYRVQSSKYLQIMRQSIEVQRSTPLSLLQIAFAEEDGPNSVPKKPSRMLSDTEVASRCDAAERRIISRCCGLIEVGERWVFKACNSTINFLHKSVLDFLQKPETWASVTVLTKDIGYDTNWTLASSCLSLLRSFPFNDSTAKEVCLIMHYLLRYCRDAETTSHRADLGFLREVSRLFRGNLDWISNPSDREHDSWVETFRFSYYLPSKLLHGQGPKPLTIAVAHCFPLHLQEELNLRPPSYLKEEGAVLLGAAVSPRSLRIAGLWSYLPALAETVVCLIRNGADPNLATGGQMSPWRCALSTFSALQDALGNHHRRFSNTNATSFMQDSCEILLQTCEALLWKGAHANAVIFRPCLVDKTDPLSWLLEENPKEAFSALAVIEDFFRTFLEVYSDAGLIRFEKLEEIRKKEKRLVGLMIERGAESRKWIDGKQVSGPVERTALAVLVERSSVSVGQRNAGVVSLGPEAEPSSLSPGQQNNEAIRPPVATKSGKGFSASFRNWRKSHSGPVEDH
jgi:hypothetical protein